MMTSVGVCNIHSRGTQQVRQSGCGECRGSSARASIRDLQSREVCLGRSVLFESCVFWISRECQPNETRSSCLLRVITHLDRIPYRNLMIASDTDSRVPSSICIQWKSRWPYRKGKTGASQQVSHGGNIDVIYKAVCGLHMEAF